MKKKKTSRSAIQRLNNLIRQIERFQFRHDVSERVTDSLNYAKQDLIKIAEQAESEHTNDQ